MRQSPSQRTRTSLRTNGLFEYISAFVPTKCCFIGMSGGWPQILERIPCDDHSRMALRSTKSASLTTIASSLSKRSDPKGTGSPQSECLCIINGPSRYLPLSFCHRVQEATRKRLEVNALDVERSSLSSPGRPYSTASVFHDASSSTDSPSGEGSFTFWHKSSHTAHITTAETLE